MMAKPTLSVSINVRWWVIPYLRTLALFAMTFGCQPDPAKVVGIIVRYGLRIEVGR